MRVPHSAIHTSLLLIITLDNQKLVEREDVWIMLFLVGLWPLDFSEGNQMPLVFIITKEFFLTQQSVFPVNTLQLEFHLPNCLLSNKVENHIIVLAINTQQLEPAQDNMTVIVDIRHQTPTGWEWSRKIFLAQNILRVQCLVHITYESFFLIL